MQVARWQKLRAAAVQANAGRGGGRGRGRGRRGQFRTARKTLQQSRKRKREAEATTATEAAAPGSDLGGGVAPPPAEVSGGGVAPPPAEVSEPDPCGGVAPELDLGGGVAPKARGEDTPVASVAAAAASQGPAAPSSGGRVRGPNTGPPLIWMDVPCPACGNPQTGQIKYAPHPGGRKAAWHMRIRDNLGEWNQRAPYKHVYRVDDLVDEDYAMRWCQGHCRQCP